MSFTLAAIDVETIKTVALGVSGASLVLGLILMKVVSSIVGKIVSLLIFVAIAVAGFSQRQAIIDCADKVRDQVTAGSANGTKVATTCRFFGRDLTIDVDLPVK